jgi:hypothetical protein
MVFLFQIYLVVFPMARALKWLDTMHVWQSLDLQFSPMEELQALAEYSDAIWDEIEIDMSLLARNN